MITLHNKIFVPFIDDQALKQTVESIAGRINHDFAGKEPVFLSVLNGSFMFTSDLLKHIAVPCEVSFVKIASYQGTKSTGNVKTLIGLDIPVNDRDVIIIEDIVDTGKTLNEFIPMLNTYTPRSIHICTLLHKPSALIYPVPLHYVGFEIEDKFVVGYGLDFDGLGRNLKCIYQISE